jgi:pyrroline-5-carboxylate reductase
MLAYVIETFVDAAKAVGFDEADATRLAVMTFAGTGQYLAETGESPTALRERVTSPGGTTAAGIAALEAAGLPEAMKSAALAARDRGTELRSA